MPGTVLSIPEIKHSEIFRVYIPQAMAGKFGNVMQNSSGDAHLPWEEL